MVTYKQVYKAIENNQLNKLKQYVNKGYVLEKELIFNEFIFNGIPENTNRSSNDEFLTFTLIDQNIGCVKNICYTSTFFNRFEILKWVYEKGCKLDPILIYFAIQNDNLEMLKWFESKGCQYDAQMYFCRIYQRECIVFGRKKPIGQELIKHILIQIGDKKTQEFFETLLCLSPKSQVIELLNSLEFDFDLEIDLRYLLSVEIPKEYDLLNEKIQNQSILMTNRKQLCMEELRDKLPMDIVKYCIVTYM